VLTAEVKTERARQRMIVVRPGDRYGRLAVIGEEATEHAAGRSFRRFSCRCECGVLVSVRLQNLRSGQVESCGCVYVQHGHASRMARTRTYHSWQCMIQRCSNPSATGYGNYGGRGVTVCERWANSFESFLSDMGERPPRHTLDRYPNPNGNYEPGNCRWAIQTDQMRNMRRNRWITFGGETLCLTDWSLRTGLPIPTLIYRLDAGWPIKDVLTRVPSHARRADA
jgi:hypothetical protein